MTSELTFHSHSEQDTELFGKTLADALQPGLTVALNGDLGSGKTRLVRAVCEALGADPARVNSPTFVLLQSYTDGRLPVSHFDTYRLADTDEFLAIGADEFLSEPNVICFVEWADRVAEVLPTDRLTIRIRQTGATSRTIHMSSAGPASDAVVADVQSSVVGNRQRASDHEASHRDQAMGPGQA
ncbi:MAG: tRNA (adenosine(37)-N6)-threonylcarbamoyltransferase complex ATPase subunit type 1 TsaE [Planctomycetaceae bacterium]